MLNVLTVLEVPLEHARLARARLAPADAKRLRIFRLSFRGRDFAIGRYPV